MTKTTTKSGMKGLTWRADKRQWLLSYRDSANARRQYLLPVEITKSMATVARDHAKGFLEKRAVAGDAPVRRRRGDGPTVGEVKTRWLEYRKGKKVDGKRKYKSSTQGDNLSHLNTWILPTFKDTPVSGLTVQALRAWLDKLSAECSTSHTRNVIATFRAMIDDAMAGEWVALAANPLNHPGFLREVPKQKRATAKHVVFVELADAQKLINCEDVPARRRVRYIVDFTTGLSEGELAGRRWRDIGLAGMATIAVPDACATRGDDGWASIQDTKNEHRVRKLPLHSAAVAALTWWKTKGWVLYVGRAPTPDDPVFPGRVRGEQRATKAAIFSRPASAMLLRRDLKTAGCADTMNGSPITAQSIRRSFSTYLDAAGVHDEQRGRLMGHAAKTVTAKHYTAAQLETDRAAIETIALTWPGDPKEDTK